MNRRDFLIASALVLASGQMIGDVCVKEYQKGVLKEETTNQRDITFKIYNELPKQVYLANHKAKIKTVNGGWNGPTARDGESFYEEETDGYGIIVNGYYITCAHISDFSKTYVRSVFGIMKVSREVLETHSKINGHKLESLVSDIENDIAIFSIVPGLPGEPKLKNFDAEPSTNRQLGDEIYVIGNPALTGMNVRKGTISDLNTYKPYKSEEESICKNCFGIDKGLIGGDSGTPVVNKDGKLIGINAVGFANALGYVKKIEEYLKYIK